MQTKYPIHNPGKNVMFVGGTMIPPGETQHFTLEQLPVYLRPAPASPEPVAPSDPVVDLLAGSVKVIATVLPSMSDEDLARLAEMEQAKGDAARKTLLAAIAEEQLTRADAKAAAASAASGADGTDGVNGAADTGNPGAA